METATALLLASQYNEYILMLFPRQMVINEMVIGIVEDEKIY